MPVREAFLGVGKRPNRLADGAGGGVRGLLTPSTASSTLVLLLVGNRIVSVERGRLFPLKGGGASALNWGGNNERVEKELVIVFKNTGFRAGVGVVALSV